jgi:hypothetical protein
MNKKGNHLMQREILSLMQNKSGKNASKIVSQALKKASCTKW